jgi:hypothetical protein
MKNQELVTIHFRIEKDLRDNLRSTITEKEGKLATVSEVMRKLIRQYVEGNTETENQNTR